jgi:hypothetical protein
MRMTWPKSFVLSSFMVAFPVRPLFRFATTSLAEPRGHRPSLKSTFDQASTHTPGLTPLIYTQAQYQSTKESQNETAGRPI